MSSQDPNTLLLLLTDALTEQSLTDFCDSPDVDHYLNTDDAVLNTEERCREGLIRFVTYFVETGGVLHPAAKRTPEMVAFQAEYNRRK